jgi:hypothetical protein
MDEQERELHMVPSPWDAASAYWYTMQELHKSLDVARVQLAEARRLCRVANDEPGGHVPVEWFDFNTIDEKIRVARAGLPTLPETYARIDGGCTLPAPEATTGVL